MSQKISPRLLEIVNALPLQDGVRVLEIGCGPGVAARAVAHRIKNGYVLAIDRSAKAIELAIKNSQAEIQSGILEFKQLNAEKLSLPKVKLFDFAFAIRVGALDGRHREIEKAVIHNIKKVLKPNGRLFIDGGNPLKEITL